VAAKAPKERKENHLGSASLFTRWVNAGLAQKPVALRSLRLFVAIPFSFLGLNRAVNTTGCWLFGVRG
jgi:hypothetical protein